MTADIVERFNQYAGPHGRRSDMFGFADIVALDLERHAIVAIQCCGQSKFAVHRRTILEDCNEAVGNWLACGGVIELWAWRKVKLHRGGKAMRWKPRVEIITQHTLAIEHDTATGI
jgi:hypothetical protein